ncbi:MAG: hypothetical protein K9N10_10195 [Deltaproteobacteria bacterium]|nr:hypothetical protein [Deltaproteobacteria bacterium]
MRETTGAAEMSPGKGIKWGFGIVIAIFIVNLTAILTFPEFFGDDKIEFIPTDISNPTIFNRELAVQEMKFSESPKKDSHILRSLN